MKPYARLVTDPEEIKRIVRSIGERHPVLSEVGLHTFRGGSLFALLDGGPVPLSVSIMYFGKRRKNTWEPYANWLTAYTPVDERRKGHATTLYRAVEAVAIEKGCRRLKSLAGSEGGLLLHASLGHLMWGLTDTGEVKVDTPLVADEFPGVPPQCNALVTAKDVLYLLGDEKLRYDRSKK